MKTHRHAFASLFQSVVDDLAERIGLQSADPNAAREPNHPLAVAADHLLVWWEAGRPPRLADPLRQPDGSPAQAAVGRAFFDCSRLVFELILALGARDRELARRTEAELRFSSCDPRWLEVVVDYLEHFGANGANSSIPYRRWRELDDFVLETLPPNARVALVGDWGTGTAAAQQVMEAIARQQPDVVIHLGNIYYAGTLREGKRWFLEVANRALRRDQHPIPIYTLAGNHDMYSGGQGYYDLLPLLNPSPQFASEQAQPASYFGLRSPAGWWQLLAMDTGLHDHDPFRADEATWLERSEISWHADKIRRWSERGGTTILLSHHQLFSGFEAIGPTYAPSPALNPNLKTAFDRFSKAGSVAAWFWGHEHKLGVYRPWSGLERGRCLGCGAIPVFADCDPYRPLAGVDDLPELVEDPHQPGRPLQLPVTADGELAHAFVVLDLDDTNRSARARYLTAGGVELFSERIA